MKEKIGKVFSVAEDNPPVPGCTISKEIHRGENYIANYSLAQNTDISAEIYPYYKLIIITEGQAEVYTADGEKKDLRKGDSILTLTDIPIGVRTEGSTVYTEISIRAQDVRGMSALRRPKWNGEDEIMNEAIKAGEVFKLAELVPYQDGKIVNMDVVHNDKMKFVVMAFDEGTGLSEHAAPGEALIFALDGEGVIGYEGSEHPIKAGENFHFAKGGMHSVKATGKFKMALLLTLE